MTSTETPEEARAIWVEALRSGEYEQVGGMLHKRFRGKDSYCCLGVACKLYAERYNDLIPTATTIGHSAAVKYIADNGYGSSEAILPDNVMAWLGLKHRDGTWSDSDSLAGLNDIGNSFVEIADVIEYPPEGLLA